MPGTRNGNCSPKKGGGERKGNTEVGKKKVKVPSGPGEKETVKPP